MISFVTQDNFLFRCSILENIRLGNPTASDEEVRGSGKKGMLPGIYRETATGL